MSITGPTSEGTDGEPMKVGVAIVDITAGLQAAVAILTALQHRDRTGEGQQIDIALYDTQLSWLANVASGYLLSGEPPRRYGNAPWHRRTLSDLFYRRRPSHAGGGQRRAVRFSGRGCGRAPPGRTTSGLPPIRPAYVFVRSSSRRWPTIFASAPPTSGIARLRAVGVPWRPGQRHPDRVGDAPGRAPADGANSDRRQRRQDQAGWAGTQAETAPRRIYFGRRRCWASTPMSCCEKGWL